MPDSIGISQLLKDSADGIKEVCIQYNKRNPVGSRFYVFCVKIKHLQNLMFHVKDMERIGKNVELEISVAQSDLFSLLDAAMERAAKCEQKENNKVMIEKRISGQTQE